MAFETMFMDSSEDVERPVTGQKWAELNTAIMSGGNGVVNIGSPLTVSEKQNMEVTLSSGGIFIEGYLGNNGEEIDLELDTADSNEDRIDRIVIRLDSSPTERQITAEVVTGTPGTDPSPPSLTREGDIYEMSVAQIFVTAGQSFVEDSDITDERGDDSVCGYTNLSNLLRGVTVDENGLVTLPNQSYVEVSIDSINIELEDRVKTTIPLSPTNIDRQNEISDDKFTAKSSGAYVFFGYIAFDENVLATDSDVQILFNLNGVQQSPLVARTPATSDDNIYSGSSIQQLEAGDELDFKAYVINAPSGLETRNHRIRIAKVS